MAHTNAGSHDTHYFVPQPSIYPFILSGGLFVLISTDSRTDL